MAAAAVLGCLLLRTALEPFGQFYYLPMVPAVVITALVSRRGPTALAIVLSVGLNVAAAPREGLTDTVVNATLFVAVGWVLAEICWLQRRVQRRAIELARDLAGRNAMLDTVYAAVPLVILDRSGAVRRLTPAAARLFGLEEGAAVGGSFRALVPDFDFGPCAAGRPLEAPGGVWRARRSDGQELALSLQLGIAGDEAGGDYAAVSITDVTATQAATTRALELDAQLNRVWRLNSLGEMSATLAHELNQPLSAAASYIHASERDIERSGPLGDSAARTLQLAKAQVLRAGAIIRRMRDLLDTGTAHLRPERVSSMIEDLGPSLQLLGRQDGIRVQVDVDDETDRVRAERIQFQQAVINLVRNAIEAVSNRPEPLVSVSGRKSGANYVIDVEDNGPGIPGDDFDFGFQPMTSSKSTGMGLGLSVTRTIVEGHGGELRVSRSRFGGAAFSICLPSEEPSHEAPGYSLHH